ncbi:MAG: M48 family metalloprotease [Acidobacteria bacterium]|nr:M48 family metalloprotease [Acidobacteriota bacterium]
MRHFRKVFALSACLTLLLSPAGPTAGTLAAARLVKVRGYITNVLSPTSFEIDDYRVTREESLALDFENESPEARRGPEALRVGAEVEVSGAYDEATGELKADHIKVDLGQFRSFKMAAVLSREPEGVELTPEGWRGYFFPDGHRVRVEPSTEVLFKPNDSEEKALKERAKAEASKKQKEAKVKDSKAAERDAAAKSAETADEGDVDEEDAAGLQPLRTLKDVGVGMRMTYEGTEQPDGTVLARRVVFSRNEKEKGEAALWKWLKVKEKPSNFVEGKPGELKIDLVGKFKLLPNEEVQAYVSDLGQRLVPDYQRRLPAEDPQKIPFKFYVVMKKDANAFALANGIVVVHSGLFEVLENEAQLAAVLSHEIAHATQEHTWRQMNKDKKKRMALGMASIGLSLFGMGDFAFILDTVKTTMESGYSRTLENQADRVGLEYMVDAGYDPREAARVWTLMKKKYGDAPVPFFWATHENHLKRRSFIMLEIRNNYSNLDLASTRKGSEEEFKRLAGLAREASAKKKKA